jgi:hypothetical protein
MPSMTPPTTPSRPRKIAVPLRKSKSQYSSPLEQSMFGNIPPSPSKCGPCLIQHTPPSRSPSPYTCPRTPPLPTPPLTASCFPGPPSADYLNTRRGSNTSTSSSTSSVRLFYIFPRPLYQLFIFYFHLDVATSVSQVYR